MRPTYISHSKPWKARFVLWKIQAFYSLNLFIRKSIWAFSAPFIYPSLTTISWGFPILIWDNYLLMLELIAGEGDPVFDLLINPDLCHWSLLLTKNPNNWGIPISPLLWCHSHGQTIFLSLYIIDKPPQSFPNPPVFWKRNLVSLFCIYAEPDPTASDKYIV